MRGRDYLSSLSDADFERIYKWRARWELFKQICTDIIGVLSIIGIFVMFYFITYVYQPL